MYKEVIRRALRVHIADLDRKIKSCKMCPITCPSSAVSAIRDADAPTVPLWKPHYVRPYSETRPDTEAERRQWPIDHTGRTDVTPLRRKNRPAAASAGPFHGGGPVGADDWGADQGDDWGDERSRTPEQREEHPQRQMRPRGTPRTAGFRTRTREQLLEVTPRVQREGRSIPFDLDIATPAGRRLAFEPIARTLTPRQQPSLQAPVATRPPLTPRHQASLQAAHDPLRAATPLVAQTRSRTAAHDP